MSTVKDVVAHIDLAQHGYFPNRLGVLLYSAFTVPLGLQFRQARIQSFLHWPREASWSDWQRSTQVETQLITQVLEALFQDQYGTNQDPMHVDLKKFHQPSELTLKSIIDVADEALGSDISEEDKTNLAALLHHDWYEVVVPPHLHEMEDSLLYLIEPPGTPGRVYDHSEDHIPF